MVLQATAGDRRPRQAPYAHFRLGHGTAPPRPCTLPWAPGDSTGWLQSRDRKQSQRCTSLSELLTAGLGAHLKFPSSRRAFEQAELPLPGSSGSSPILLSKPPRGTMVSDTKQIKRRYFFFKQQDELKWCAALQGQIHIDSKSEINMESDS